MRYSERQLERALSIEDLRILARRRLPKAVFDFIDGGAADERTMRDNATAFDDWLLMPRVAVDVSNRHLGRSILGSPSAMPMMLSPTGLAGSSAGTARSQRHGPRRGMVCRSAFPPIRLHRLKMWRALCPMVIAGFNSIFFAIANGWMACSAAPLRHGIVSYASP